ncbi:phage tail assembly chaperone [Pseudomonas sp. NFACC45]|uniref:phage tail assembly chaperone n=1 Tax=Pseudomonas sp. NFACC45 TaxID=1566201 RepID=UPI0008EBE800|nr:phage tail assembly chaperone [Pseudomonas sp. NFACC45]SFH13034.1 Phage tail assembly chaperone protein [Pseudomonas sp. NFACC45]
MWALIVDGVVREVTGTDPVDRFHPSLEWLPCTVGTVQGERYIEGAFMPAATEEAALVERAWRDGALSASEWLVNRHRDEQGLQRPTTLGTEQFDEMLTYRQALRDWPQAVDFPNSAQRPMAPVWLTGME